MSLTDFFARIYSLFRAVARSENPGGLVVLGGDNVLPLVEIGLTDLPKSGGAMAPHGTPSTTPLPLKVISKIGLEAHKGKQNNVLY